MATVRGGDFYQQVGLKAEERYVRLAFHTRYSSRNLCQIATSPSSPSVDMMSPLTVAHSRSAERVGNRSDLAPNNEFVTHGLPLNDAAISTLSVQRRPFANSGLDGQTSPSQRRSFVLDDQLGVSEDLDSEVHTYPGAICLVILADTTPETDAE